MATTPKGALAEMEEVSTGMTSPTNGATGPTLLSREAILSADDIPAETVEVPEWGGTVLVRGMTGRDRDGFERELVEVKGKDVETNWTNFRAKLVARSIVDNAGATIFKTSDVPALGAKSAVALQRVFEVAQRLSGMSDEDVKELTEDLKTDPSGDSGSA